MVPPLVMQVRAAEKKLRGLAAEPAYAPRVKLQPERS
jgi:hypothetical protein